MRLVDRGGPLTLVAVLALTLAALWIRLDGLQGWDGTLTVDEARLALAARGINQTGLPRLPSGWVYTRGLLATYLTAPSLALLGESDFATRLPAVLAGALLVPVAYLLGREVAGRLGGLAVAALCVGHPSLVVWSRQAWFYALFVLLFALALLFLLRAARTGRPSDQLLAGVCVGLSAFAHEAGMFLLLPLTVQAGLALWPVRRDRAGWWPPVVSVGIVGLAAVALWLLVTHLRAESLVGAYGEVEEYLSPSVEWARIRFYLRMLADGPGVLLAGAVLGTGLAIRRKLVPTLLLWLALLPSFVHAAFLIPRGPQERYGLAMLLVIVVLGVQGLRQLAEAAAGLAERRRRLGVPPDLLTPLVVGLALVGTVAAHQDVRRAVDRAALSAREGAWLRQARSLGIDGDAVVMTDVPTTVGWYIGGLDFWVSSHDYEKYTTRVGDIRRDVHTGAVLVRSRGDYDRLVARPLAGRQVWVIASGRNYQWGELVDDDLKSLLDRSASQRVNPGDNTRILLVNLPSGS
ncbi:MAG: glycosyltransferase family 39 protein [Chloroflexi bacterium]|nr:glycosyltransferase family 39 protein [Chloroflexota bacterium]